MIVFPDFVGILLADPQVGRRFEIEQAAARDLLPMDGEIFDRLAGNLPFAVASS